MSKFPNPSRHSFSNREANDWYPEPAFAVEALLDQEEFQGRIWDPACGSLTIPRVCHAHGHSDILATDLTGGPDGELDFLECGLGWKVDNVITNPPFKLAEKFALHAISLTSRKVALFTRFLWLEAIGRYERIFSLHPPARVWLFSYRIQVGRISTKTNAWVEPGRGGGTAYAWVVWDKNKPNGPTELGWIHDVLC